jgi:hemolysin activation/secretion protein
LAQSSLQQEQVRGQPLQVQVLERATRLLTEIPGLSASVRLAAGELPDETDVWVSAASRSSVRGAVSVDNAGNKSIGANALAGVLVWDNYLGQGESVHAQVQASRGLRALRGGLSLPAGSHGWRLGAELAGLRYRLLNEFSALDGTGDIRSIALWAQVPLTREPTMDSNFRAELGAQHSRNLIQGASISDKRGESLSLTWDWQRTGDTVFPDSSRWRLQGKAGRLDLSGQAANLVADQSGPKTNGTFAKLSFSYSGVRRMDAVTDLQLHVSGQLAAKNLDAAEQLNMGGPEAVRAFGSNDTSGDAGIFARWELVRHVNHEVEISTFVDQGLLRLRRFPEPVSTSAPNSRNLLGFGAGLRWALPGGTDVHAELSRGVLPDPSSQDQLSSRPESGPRGVRLWVHASLRF